MGILMVARAKVKGYLVTKLSILEIDAALGSENVEV
jgi:hypothetical protein